MTKAKGAARGTTNARATTNDIATTKDGATTNDRATAIVKPSQFVILPLYQLDILST
jgi:hypothetical protein